MSASLRGGAGGHDPVAVLALDPHHLSSWWETVSGGQFDWGGRLLKGNGGAQRFPQNGWKSFIECKGIRELDCETYKSEQGRKTDLVIRWFRMEGPSLNQYTRAQQAYLPQEFTSRNLCTTSAHRILGL